MPLTILMIDVKILLLISKETVYFDRNLFSNITETNYMCIV